MLLVNEFLSLGVRMSLVLNGICQENPYHKIDVTWGVPGRDRLVVMVLLRCGMCTTFCI